jgi:hypothetical protein
MASFKVLAIVSVVLLLLGCVAAYFLYNWYKKKSDPPSTFGTMNKKVDPTIGFVNQFGSNNNDQWWKR